MAKWKCAGSWLLAGVLGAFASLAQAAVSVPVTEGPVTTSATHAVVAPGGQARPVFSFTFDAPFDMVAALLNVEYDGGLMSFNAGASTLGMGATVLPLALVPGALQLAAGGAPFSVAPPQDEPGLFSASGGFDGPGAFFPVPAGTFVFTPVFDLKPSFLAGMQTQVIVWGDLASPSAQAPAMFEALATVTAVPEPEAWLMLLGGLGLVVARARRRATAARR